MTGKADLLHLAWEDHLDTVLDSLKRYQLSQIFCNLTICAEGRSIKVHQEIMSAVSPWFETTLSGMNPNGQPIVVLKDVLYEDLVHVVEFVYAGKVNVTKEGLHGFLVTAKLLQIKGLDEAVQSRLDDEIEEDDPAEPTEGNPLEASSIPSLNSEKSEALDVPEKVERASSPPQTEQPVRKRCRTEDPEPQPAEPDRQNKEKPKREYESDVPVYDNRQFYAGDLLQTQLDCSGEAGNDELYHDLAPLSGTEDCGMFKKSWSHNYLCYNLGRQILCLICFCRFSRFKKFNLARHMQRKHPNYYQLDEETKKLMLNMFVTRYEENVTPSIMATIPAQGNEIMAAELLQMPPIACNVEERAEDEETNDDLNMDSSAMETEAEEPHTPLKILECHLSSDS